MADQLDTVALLTRAAELLEQTAEDHRRMSLVEWAEIAPRLTDRLSEPTRRLLAAFGPDFARAVAATFRAQLELHGPSATGEHCCCCAWTADGPPPYPCSTLLTLGPLAELVVQNLGDER